MVEVIPAILTKSQNDLEALVKKIEPYSAQIHLDISDGKFTPEATIGGYKELNKIESPTTFSAHLMIEKPEGEMHNWYKTGVQTIILHAETNHILHKIAEDLKFNGKKLAVAINPKTRLDNIFEFMDKIDFIHFMTVNPGFQGAKFLPEVLDKISYFHQRHPSVKISVDGGMTPETAPRAVAAGASIIVSGSYIFRSQDPGKALEELRRSVN